MTDDVFVVQGDLAVALDPLQSLDRVDQPIAHMGGQIDLRGIAGDHHLRAQTHPGQKHLHLGHGRVLRFIQDHKRLVQRTTPHVCQRDHFDQILLCVAFDLLVVHHFAKGIEQGAEIRIDFGL